MRTKKSWFYGAAALALVMSATGSAQPVRDPGLSGPEREELRELLRRFAPERPSPQNLPWAEQRWLLEQLRQLAVFELAPPESETLTVCDTIGDAHLLMGDVITLTRIGASGNVRMDVVRNPGAPNESHPWTNPGGGNTIILNPAITGKPHPTNPAFKKFTPEAVGRARVDPHTGGTPTDHDFFLRRNARTPDDRCSNPDPLMLTVPEQHASGGRHGGHAVLD